MFDLYFKKTPGSHQYYVSSTGTVLRNKYFNTRKEAEAYMNNYCYIMGIGVECTECDKHERFYTDHNGVEFCINRI